MQRRGLLSALAAVLLCSAAAANEGAIEINAVRAAAGAINGDLTEDPPGLPVIITAPGSYRLTSNLEGGGAAAQISILASDVTLDLNGFSLLFGTRGVDGTGDNIAVSNGAVAAMDEFGIWLTGKGSRVERVRAISNVIAGIDLNDGSVSDSIAIANGTGINVSRGSVVRCVVSGGGVGITQSTGGGAPALVVSHDAVISSGFGVSVENGSVVENLVVGNANTGLLLQTSGPGFFASGFARNVVNGNAGSAWTGTAVQTGPNVCLGNGGSGC